MTLTPEQQALREAAMAATPGEWTHYRHGVIVAGPFHKYTNGTAQSQIAMFGVTNGSECETENKQIANSEFCALANPAAILALLAQLESATAPADADKTQAFQQEIS